jgi:hypothetical protein
MQFSQLTKVLWEIRDWGSDKDSFAGSRKGIGPPQAQEDANDGDAHHGEEMRRVLWIYCIYSTLQYIGLRALARLVWKNVV